MIYQHSNYVYLMYVIFCSYFYIFITDLYFSIEIKMDLLDFYVSFICMAFNM